MSPFVVWGKQHWSWDKKQMLFDVFSQLSMKGNNNLHLLSCTQPNGSKTVPKALPDLWWLDLSVRGKLGAVNSWSKRKACFKGGDETWSLQLIRTIPKKTGNKFQLCPAKWKINQVPWQASEYMLLLQKLAASDFSLGADRKGASILYPAAIQQIWGSRKTTETPSWFLWIIHENFSWIHKKIHECDSRLVSLFSLRSFLNDQKQNCDRKVKDRVKLARV